MLIEYLGHSAFLVTHDKYSLLFDPFLSGNSLAAKKPEELNPTHILVSHGHSDHIGDTVEIAKKNNSIVYSTFEITEMVSKEGIKVQSGNIGGKISTEFGSVKYFRAIHSSGVPGGIACSFIVEIGDNKIFFAGDTALFYDMKLLEAEKIDLALLPIGSVFTMGIDDAVKAVEFISPKTVIPMHYNTFPAIKQDPYEFKKMVEKDLNTKVIVLDPGQSVNY